jgi:cell division protein FtsA
MNQHVGFLKNILSKKSVVFIDFDLFFYNFPINTKQFMSKDPYQVAIDVGSSSIKLAVVKESSESNNKLQVLTLIERESLGIRKGIITNMSEATDSLIDIINQAESVIGLPIKNAVVGVNSPSITFTNSEGLAIISSSDNEIRDMDVDRVVQDSLAKAFGIQNSEIIHLITKNFRVDNQGGIKYPTGMIGNKLEAKTLIISCDTSYLRNFNKVFNQANIDISETIFTPLASSDYILSLRQKKAGTVMIDFGYASTSYIVWENEEIVHSGIIPVGSDHITADLAVGLQTNIEMAEEIKKIYLDLSNNEQDEDSSIEIFNPDLQVNESFKIKEVNQYAKPRVEEIFVMILKELKKIGKTSLPGGAVIIGGGSSLKGIDEIAKQILRIPTFKYVFDKNQIEFVPDYNNDPSFINCIALAAYSYHHQEEGPTNNKKTGLNLGIKTEGAGEKISEFWDSLKKYLPF